MVRTAWRKKKRCHPRMSHNLILCRKLHHTSCYNIPTVYIAGGYTLISSRIYERTDVHSKRILKGCIYQRFPDMGDSNFDLVKVHRSISAIEPVVNHARNYYVAVFFEEELRESTVVLKLDLPPYVDIGAIVVPLTLSKRRLIVQTGIDMVCGPDGELCVCYHNGQALLNEDEISPYDGDFFVCWLDSPAHWHWLGQHDYMWRFVDAGVAPVVITMEKTLTAYRANLQAEKAEIAKHSATRVKKKWKTRDGIYQLKDPEPSEEDIAETDDTTYAELLREV